MRVDEFKALYDREVRAIWINRHGFVQVELRDKSGWARLPAWFRRVLIAIVQQRYGHDCLWVIRQAL